MNKLFILGLVLICIIIYANSLNNDFVLDDSILVIDNPAVKSLRFLRSSFGACLGSDSATLEKPFHKRLIDEKYRPLQVLSYAVDYRIWGLNPFGFHLTSIILHLFNAIIAYYLFSIIFKNGTVSKLVSILFLVHPIHTSVVTYISGRADILACFFMLLSMISFLKFMSKDLTAYYWLSLLSALCALLSRENALLLFLFIAIVLFAVKAKPKYYLYIIPFILTDLLYLLWRFIIFYPGAFVINKELLTFPMRVVNFFNIIPRYLFLLIFPQDLHFFRTTPFITRWLDAGAIIAVFSAIIIIAVCIKFRKNKLILFSVFWFLAGLIPVFVNLDSYKYMLGSAMMAESWLYISSIGFFAAFIFFLIPVKKISKVVIGFFIIFYSFLTIVNNVYWKNNFILHKNLLNFGSKRNYLRLNLINWYLRNCLYGEAAEEIAKFAAEYPDSSRLYYIQGDYYFATGNPVVAIEYYNKALNKSKLFFAYYHLSMCYEMLGDADKAINFSLEAFKMKPYYTPNLIRLGDLYVKAKNFQSAKKYYILASEVEPDNLLIKEKIKNAQ